MGEFLLSFFDMEKSPLIPLVGFLAGPFVFIGIIALAVISLYLVRAAIEKNFDV